MTTPALRTFTSFAGHRRIASGSLEANAFAAKAARAAQDAAPVLVFDDETGQVVDLDTRGSDEELRGRVAARLAAALTDSLVHPLAISLASSSVDPGAAAASPMPPSSTASADPLGAKGQREPADTTGPRSRGRPKLGVVSREVTLLPRHWEWLAAQPGGASVALRKLVEDARRAGGEKAHRRRAQERAYHFMRAIAGDLPGFEEAGRALFAHDRDSFQSQLADWPADMRVHALKLAFGEAGAASASA